MKPFLKICLLFWFAICPAQSKLELTSQGFQALQMKTPNIPLDNLMESSKAWASFYNKNGYDILEVTQNSLTIEARNENAFYSYNVGVKYNYDIRYSLKIVFQEDRTYKLSIAVKEIYAENVLTKITVSDFFTEDGKLKDDFRDAKPSLENTINKAIRSFVAYINR